jgi:SAM-dependent methyltransferase
MLRHPKTRRGYWGRWYHRERYTRVFEEITKFGEISSLLDIGCGEGVCAYYLHQIKPSCFYIGCDISKASIKSAHKDHYTDFILCDAHKLPIRAGSIEVVLCSEVLEHVDSPYRVLTSMCNLSRDAIIITFPDEGLGRVMGILHPEHVSMIDLERIIAELRSNGYKVLKISVIAKFSIPMGIPEFLRIPINRCTKLLVQSVSNILETFLPTILAPYRVVLVVACHSTRRLVSNKTRQRTTHFSCTRIVNEVAEG